MWNRYLCQIHLYMLIMILLLMVCDAYILVVWKNFFSFIILNMFITAKYSTINFDSLAVHQSINSSKVMNE